ncbi:MAG: chemotaxis protein CheB [Cyanobacteriota bacterium]|nr:chemotaxis protein CheB [Cyanobacteriota bacterium]
MSSPRLDSQDSHDPDPNLFVVGIGASAGGLRALEEFFEHLSIDSGAAFVVVQHLSPDFKSLMKELLERRTRMAVYRVTEGIKLEANSVYLIPPGKNLVLENGQLHLREQVERNRHGLNFPIDIFLESLAKNYADRAIGVILSGTGSDGTRGLRAIHEAGGFAMVQDPETAEFDGMPRTAIATDIVDRVLAPQDLAGVIDRLVRSGRTPDPVARDAASFLQSDLLRRVTSILAKHEQTDFSHYKTRTLSRRIHRRYLISGCSDFDAFIRLLESSARERTTLCHDLLISVTQFFRDRRAWNFLESDVIPQLVDRANPQEELRCWVTACATGEEAYSLAMLLDEAIVRANKPLRFKIFATDIDPVALEKADRGIYPLTTANEIEPERLERYFVRKDDTLQVSRHLREKLLFASHDLTQDVGFTRMKLVSCRNVLIYLQSELQQQVLRNLHFSLASAGILFLGEAETLGDIEPEFKTLHAKSKIYQKIRDIRVLSPTKKIKRHSFPSGPQILTREPERDRLEPLLNITFSEFLVESRATCFIVDRDYKLLHTFNNSLGVLNISTGRATNDIAQLILGELQLPLITALRRAQREKKPISYSGIQVDRQTESSNFKLKVTYHENTKQTSDFFAIVIQEDVSAQQISGERFEADAEASQRILELDRELQETRENLQAAIEELETTNEELQSTNEELIASNEELQSTNEELHSVNEELYTVNAEYQSKIQELTELNNDIDNLFRSTSIGVVFLDRHLNIRKFTPAATIAINLVQADIDRPLKHITHNLECANFIPLIQEVIENQQIIDREVKLVEEDTYLLMRINPYLLEDGRLDGVAISFVDIAELKTMQIRFRAIFDSTFQFIGLLDPGGILLEANQTMLDFGGIERDEVVGQPFWEACWWKISPETQAQLRGAIARAAGGEFVRYEVEIWGHQNRASAIDFSLRPIFDEFGNVTLLIPEGRDISERKQQELQLKLLERAVDAANIGITIADASQPDLPLIYVNSGFERMTGYEAGEIIGRNCRFLQGQNTQQPELEEVRQALAERTPCQVILRNYRRDGTLFLNQLNLSPLHDEDGTLTHFIGVQTDVTHSLEIEELLHRSEALLRTIVQIIPLGIYAGDPQRDRVLFCNDEFCRLWQLQDSCESIASGEIGHDAIMDWCLEAIDLEVFVSAAQPYTTRDDITMVEDEVPLLDGRTFRRFCVPVTEGDRVLGQLLVFEEITSRKQAEAELRENYLALGEANAKLETAREEAVAASRAKSDFVATMSHELRTPLNVILGFSDILARDGNLNEEEQQILGTILRSGEHLLSLINDILDLAKIEAGKVELVVTPFNLHQLIATTTEMVAIQADRKGLALLQEIASEVPVMVEADEAKLRQIAINLLVNAVKFTHSGRVTLRVSVLSGLAIGFDDRSYPEPPTFLRFEVEDTGVGIEPDELERIFQAFDRGVAGRRSAEGTGLGLAICRHFIELMGGRIDIESTVGVGTTVSFQIPLKTSEELSDASLSLARSAGRIVGLAPDQPTYRILIAEDRWENRQMLLKFLQPLGFEIFEAENGQEAIDLWQQHDPQLILMDMRMPVMDGYEAVRRIRRTVAGQAVAIIALTASAFDADRNVFLSAGCNDFITKPARGQNLLEKMARHLGVRYLYEERSPVPPIPERAATSITPESFAVMSRDWVDRLNYAAGTLEQEQVARIVAEIPPTHQSLQTQLQRWLDEFQFDIIYNLTQTFLDNSIEPAGGGEGDEGE